MGRRENLETRLRLRFFQRSWQNFCLGEGGGGAEWGVWIKNGMSHCKVSLVFLPHFDVFCDLLLNWPTVHGIFLYYTTIRKKKDRLPWTAWLFEDLRYFRHLKVPNGGFCLCFFFYFISLADSFFEKFFNVFTCSKQNNGENILQNSESLVQENLPCVWSPVEAWALAFSSCQELFSPPFLHFSFS